MSDENLEYSLDANLNKTLFYMDNNEINLYIEDINKEYEYETIFKRLLGNKYNITTIFAMGGKLGVMEAYDTYGESIEGKNNYYIVDGDFDRYINSQSMIVNSHFIYLNTYNIENYYIDKSACHKYAKGLLQKTDKEVNQILDFDNWLNRVVNESKKLFLSYCFLKKYYPSVKSVKRPICEFIDYKTGFERTDGAYNRFYNDVILKKDKNADIKIKQIALEYERINGADYFNLICGKFLISCLAFYLRNITGKKIDNTNLKWSLINNFDINKLNYIKKIICN